MLQTTKGTAKLSKDGRMKLVTADDRGKSSLSNIGNFLESGQQTGNHRAANEASEKSPLCYCIELHSTSPFEVLPLAIFGKLRASSRVKNAKQDAQNKIFASKNPRKAKTQSCWSLFPRAGNNPLAQARKPGARREIHIPAARNFLRRAARLGPQPNRSLLQLRETPIQRLAAEERRACNDLPSVRLLSSAISD